ncbi:uncharacterized protein LOC126852493 [Cataglyphis hispanica]|uniref:uncharacterized protein LOC126852493 n=1 Tax=Cataglyphis hispanica TaxID=1086592 RepID=UPI0021807C63|nr:uncharacterized protein LOC126852493 [Cataglyphis hispanica]
MATVDVSHFDEERKEKAVYKRRSSIFQTRIATCDQTKGNEGTSNKNRFSPNKVNKECIVQNDETFNLKEYIEKLKQERKDWQKEYKNRKIQRKNLTKQKTSVAEQGQVFDINVLTESDRVFLLTCPDYEHICQNSRKTLDAALKISTLSQHIQKLNKKFMEKMENNISIVTKNVIKLSE